MKLCQGSCGLYGIHGRWNGWWETAKNGHSLPQGASEFVWRAERETRDFVILCFKAASHKGHLVSQNNGESYVTGCPEEDGERLTLASVSVRRRCGLLGWEAAKATSRTGYKQRHFRTD